MGSEMQALLLRRCPQVPVNRPGHGERLPAESVGRGKQSATINDQAADIV